MVDPDERLAAATILDRPLGARQNRSRGGRTMGTEPRTLCDIFSIAASCGKPNLLISKVDGVWKSISAARLRFHRPCPLARPERPGRPAGRPRRDPLGEPPGVGDGGLRDPLRRRLVGPDLPDAPGRPDRAAAERLRGEGDLRLDPRAARQDPDDQGPVPDPRPRDPDRRQPARRARLHDLPRPSWTAAGRRSR